MPPDRDLPLGVPALDGGRRHVAELRGHGPDAAELFEDALHSEALQDDHDVRLAHRTRTFGVRQSHSRAMCENRIVADMGPSEIVEELKRLQVPHDAIAKVIGRDRTAATKMLSGKRSVKFNEVAGLQALIAEYRGVYTEARSISSIPVSVVPPFKDIARRIPVVGDVQAGVWLEAVARETYEAEEYIGLDVAGYESARLRAMRVVGPSMNKVYAPGRFVVIADPAEAGLRPGDHVVVERRKDTLTEITLKEYVEEPDGRIAFWPRSDHPDFQEPIYLRSRDEIDQDGVSIIGVVVADYGRRYRPAQ